MRVATQSVCVTKILALQRWSKIDFPPEFQIRQMHSFPIMYNTMGSKVDGLAVRDHFLPKNGLKTAILGDTILDRLTSERAGTQIFKGIANFSMCFEKFGTLSSKWAMGKASNVNSVRETNLYFFGGGGHEKLQKTDFFGFSANYLRFWYWNTYPGYHHVKPHVQTNPKMYNLVGLRWFLRQLLPLEVSTWRKKWKRHDNYEVLKKRHGHNFGN